MLIVIISLFWICCVYWCAVNILKNFGKRYPEWKRRFPELLKRSKSKMSQNAKKQGKFTCRLETRTLNRKIFHWKTRWDTVSLVSLLLTTWGKSYRLWYFPGKLWQTACQSIAFPSRSQQCFQWNTTRVNVCVRSKHVFFRFRSWGKRRFLWFYIVFSKMSIFDDNIFKFYIF